MRNSSTLRRIPVSSLLAAAAALIGLSTADAQLFVGKKEIERQTRVEWLSMKRGLPIHPSERLQAYVACVAYDIIDVLAPEYQNLDWEVVVFDDEMANASVLPGGKIAVFSGILDVADTPASLAAVLGHEAAHLTQDHVTERLRRAQRTNALVLLGNAATGLGGIIGGTAQIMLTLPYQREQESEADLVGMNYMAEAGYDPRATLYLWRNMAEREREQGRRQAEFMSTHPLPDVRMADLAGNLAPALGTYNAAREAGRRPVCSL
jgi:predicted Zn-dependent protease